MTVPGADIQTASMSHVEARFLHYFSYALHNHSIRLPELLIRCFHCLRVWTSWVGVGVGRQTSLSEFQAFLEYMALKHSDA